MQDSFEKFNTKKKVAEKTTTMGFVVIGIAVIVFLALMGTNEGTAQVFGFIIGAIGLIISGKGGIDFKKLSREFKYEVLVGLFKELLPGVNYQPDQGLSLNDVYATEFIKRADRSHTEDLITGKIEDVDFISSDVRLEERHVQQTKNGTRVYYVPYFIGRIFKFSFNKEFAGHLQVLEAGSPMARRDFKKVQMESIDFNKKFHIFSTDELSAFYVLTPDIMESIMHLEQRNPGRIGLSFTGDTLYIAINNNKDTFELKMYRPIDNSIIEEFKADLLVIKDVIVAMKLNNKLFKKSIS